MREVVAVFVKKTWKTVLFVASLLIVFVGVALGWRFYKNTHVHEQYSGTAEIVGYEESEDGLIVVLQTKKNAYWNWDNDDFQVRLLIDQETLMLFPNVVFMMKDRLTGFEVEFVSREFWVPDAMWDDEYIYPAYGLVITDHQWFDITEAKLVDESKYAEFEQIYKTQSDMEWLGFK